MWVISLLSLHERSVALPSQTDYLKAINYVVGLCCGRKFQHTLAYLKVARSVALLTQLMFT